MREHTLEPITPQKTKEMYLEERENARYATRRTIKDVLEIFVEWAEEDEIEDLADNSEEYMEMAIETNPVELEREDLIEILEESY